MSSLAGPSHRRDPSPSSNDHSRRQEKRRAVITDADLAIILTAEEDRHAATFDADRQFALRIQEEELNNLAQTEMLAESYSQIADGEI